MFKRISFHIIISTILFSVISFLTVIVSLLTRKESENPKVNIGFPLKYYEQFWIDNNDLHHGWNLRNFTIDFVIILTIVVVINLIRQRNESLKSK